MTTVKIPSETATPERQTQRMSPQPSLQQRHLFSSGRQTTWTPLFSWMWQEGQRGKRLGWGLSLISGKDVGASSGMFHNRDWVARLRAFIKCDSRRIGRHSQFITSPHLSNANVAEWPGSPSQEAAGTRKSKVTESWAWQGPQNSCQSRPMLLKCSHTHYLKNLCECWRMGRESSNYLHISERKLIHREDSALFKVTQLLCGGMGCENQVSAGFHAAISLWEPEKWRGLNSPSNSKPYFILKRYCSAMWLRDSPFQPLKLYQSGQARLCCSNK